MLKNIVLTILSATMLVAAFPPIDMEFLSWFGMAPFFLALNGKHTAVGKNIGTAAFKLNTRGFFLGLLWGIVFFLGTVYWVVNSMVNYGGISLFISVLILILLVAYLSIFPAVFGLIVLSMRTSLLAKILTISSVWTALEYLRANMILGGFPWVLLGYSQSSFLPLIQITDITGVYGVSFLIVAVNLLSSSTLLYWSGREETMPLTEGLVVFIVLAGVLFYGFARVSHVDRVSARWNALKIGIAQGNIEQGEKWDASFQKETVEIYKNLSLALAKQGARLIIWPESAVPFYLQSEKELGHEIYNVPKESSAYLFTGADSYGLDPGGEVKYYNSAFLLSPGGEIVGKYDKIHLVPFGEYVPLKKYLPFIHKLVAGVGDFSSGKWLKPLAFDGNSFGVLICFESIFPELARGFIKEGAGFLVNITNDAWFGRASAPYQHFSQAIFRAVENKAYLVRAANTGISGVIDPVGRVKLKSGIFMRETLTVDVKIKDAQLFTFYSRYGDIFAIGCIALFIGCWLLVVRRKK
ncbi:MAG: apolipoprotein N-acyltransferase [Deltaproteobacteria bacterium]|nr:apolipoprotein N-acyltransferase [Deltaproteobacteria bacterium]